VASDTFYRFTANVAAMSRAAVLLYCVPYAIQVSPFPAGIFFVRQAAIPGGTIDTTVHWQRLTNKE
jgi:hypothetical protein